MYTAQPGFNELEGRQDFTMLKCYFVIWSVGFLYDREDENNNISQM
jgi:hypothetical protein